MKIFYILAVIIIGAAIWWGISFNKNPLVTGTVRTESGVTVTVKEYSKKYSQYDLQKYLKNYPTETWNIILLPPPAYPAIYKLTTWKLGNPETAIWYSGKYLIIATADDLFKDGSPQESVLEKYDELYPNSVDVTQKKSRLMILISSFIE